ARVWIQKDDSEHGRDSAISRRVLSKERIPANPYRDRRDHESEAGRWRPDSILFREGALNDGSRLSTNGRDRIGRLACDGSDGAIARQLIFERIADAQREAGPDRRTEI